MANNPANYKNPPSTPSSVGDQLTEHHYNKAALIEVQKTQVFQPLADVRYIPKHSGKSIKQFLYLPLLDDRNINDQGIDAAGADIADGNLYGSSNDIGVIAAKLPALAENGGRVNKVGYTRKVIEGSIKELGFFDEFSEDLLNFDSDAQLKMHLARERMRAANKISENVLAIDLIQGAGVVHYCGIATNDGSVTGEGSDVSKIEYADLMRVSITLDDNSTPRQTKMLTGVNLTNTRTLPAARIIYIGSELQVQFEKMKDFHNEAAFKPVHEYAANAGGALAGEIGSVGYFRVVVVNDSEMPADLGKGAAVTSNGGYRETGSKYDIFYALIVGDGSFSTIGFQNSKGTGKFVTHTQMAGSEAAFTRDNPYGKLGFSSIRWWYGTMILRPERLAVLKSVAEM